MMLRNRGIDARTAKAARIMYETLAFSKPQDDCVDQLPNRLVRDGDTDDSVVLQDNVWSSV